jgi:hypothetical protein
MLSILFAWWYWEPELEAGLTRIWQSPIFGGRNRGLSRRVAIGAVGAFVALGAVWFILAAFQFTLPDLGPVDPLRDGTILLVGIAAIQAYYNDGLLVSWVVVFAPLASVGFLSIGTGLAGGSMLSVVGIVGYSVIIGTVGALVLGTGGFLLGASGRRVVAKLSRSLRERNMS